MHKIAARTKSDVTKTCDKLRARAKSMHAFIMETSIRLYIIYSKRRPTVFRADVKVIAVVSFDDTGGLTDLQRAGQEASVGDLRGDCTVQIGEETCLTTPTVGGTSFDERHQN